MDAKSFLDRNAPKSAPEPSAVEAAGKTVVSVLCNIFATIGTGANTVSALCHRHGKDEIVKTLSEEDARDFSETLAMLPMLWPALSLAEIPDFPAEADPPAPIIEDPAPIVEG